MSLSLPLSCALGSWTSFRGSWPAGTALATSFTDTPGGYPICTFTYELVFKNPTTAGVTTSVAQATNRKAYASFITSDNGQAALNASRYDTLPAAVQAKAQAGAAAINPNA